MFYSIRGKVILTEPGSVVLENGGIGYRLTVSGRTLGRAAEDGRQGEVTLYTYLSVREDALELFGFADTDELSMFKRLISVSGVGPKAATAILTQLSPAELARAIATGDHKALSRAQGIGKRITERVILELKDKIASDAVYADASPDFAESPALMGGGNQADAESTLLVLGYNRSEIAAALRSLDMSMPLEDIIKEALKRLMK